MTDRPDEPEPTDLVLDAWDPVLHSRPHGDDREE
jgi:hypothetical protein